MAHKYKYDFLVFIGRFQPFHNSHKLVIDRALQLANKVIILLGSANSSRSLRNPWTWLERSNMILNSYDGGDRERLLITPLEDKKYNDTSWITSVQQAVQSLIVINGGYINSKVGLIGHSKDETSYYLNMFPQWGNENVPQKQLLSATTIREAYLDENIPKLSNGDPSLLEYAVDIPNGTKQVLADFEATDDYKKLVFETAYIKEYKRRWEDAPHAPTFVTVDAVVVQSGHILLVRRGAHPGYGLWALPGGFLNPNEKIEQAAIRELKEETKIKIPENILKAKIKKREVFDDPHRSDRGRTITHAFFIDLPGAANGLPKVKGSDDADYATWVPIAALEGEHMFEDHYHIVQAMIGESLSNIRPEMIAYAMPANKLNSYQEEENV